MNKSSKLIIIAVLSIVFVILLIICGLLLLVRLHDSSLHDVSEHVFFPSTDELLDLASVEEKSISSLELNASGLKIVFSDDETYQKYKNKFIIEYKTYEIAEEVPIAYNINRDWDREADDDLWFKFDKSNTHFIDLSGESIFDSALLPVWITNDEVRTIVFLYIYYLDATSVSARFVIESALYRFD